ncbi:MAG: hypothetical protein U5K37_12165 [Natrialbaceae archaeon]|nr:hypothetical protein [Natrialbaceae archaeon]
MIVVVGVGRPVLSETRQTLIEALTLFALSALGALIASTSFLASQGPSGYLLGFLWTAATLFAIWTGVTTVAEATSNR